MRTASSNLYMATIGLALFAGIPAWADDGPSMAVTEQYITNSYNQYAQEEFSSEVAQGGLSASYSISVSGCSIVETMQEDGGTGTTTFPMLKVKQATAFILGPKAEIYIEAWDDLPLFRGDYYDSHFYTDTVTMSKSGEFDSPPDDLVQAKCMAKAINHYAKLCGSVDPNTTAPDPNDPFSK